MQSQLITVCFIKEIGLVLSLLSVLVGVLLVGLCIWFYYRRMELPPNAQLICDVWELVESYDNKKQEPAGSPSVDPGILVNSP